ncbi:hypothetical protein GWI33_016229 [Rhynchophorus ferrugineus]|uniref:Uncharacterized protein n=1 Tax=Rhynchophorus ferrugineus TaxID=354439 RepID=A0A834M3M5_RHYFE|nr:hypothetical protein GWI33_000980 [Rhynchophorus ferrugineus]KAF7270822.1 hypothetical protein GWI33_016229 [Rhynchophorus ferrugineus]
MLIHISTTRRQSNPTTLQTQTVLRDADHQSIPTISQPYLTSSFNKMDAFYTRDKDSDNSPPKDKDLAARYSRTSRSSLPTNKKSNNSRSVIQNGSDKISDQAR